MVQVRLEVRTRAAGVSRDGSSGLRYLGGAGNVVTRLGGG